MGLPVWRYKVDGLILEKRVFLPHQQNTVHICYRMIEGEAPIQLRLRVSVHFRGHDEHVSIPDRAPYILTANNGRYELIDQGRTYPPLRLCVQGNSSAFMFDEVSMPDILYRVEAGRGYDNIGQMTSPGVFRTSLSPGQEVTLTASTDPWDRVLAFSPQDALEAEVERRRRLIDAALPAANDDFSKELVLAADQFVILPACRVEDSARAQATGEQARTIIAGYHWFTDWGRDSMISLEGLTLLTGRDAEASYILRTFLSHVRDGLIPNFFPDRSTEGVYHTADATLWFFHALSRYIAYTGDRATLRTHLPVLKEIIAHHQRGTRFGIGVDSEDGLLKQGAAGYQLTWMDAKVGDWVVTPRRGKAVEINALWYNALRLMETWLQEANEDASEIRAAAELAQTSFNKRFWCPAQQGLFDVVDGENGDDSACRPNQIFAISLPHPILAPEKWKEVLHTVQNRLLTPFGLRSLAPGHPDYKPQYYGDLRSRDAAYHQGTVWAWLIGPFVDAWLRVHPDCHDQCRQFIVGFQSHLNEACIGTISEVFDAEAPYLPRGCASQAWSVAEVLRVAALLSQETRR
jgi:predicted glycogen debranching enzyme